jgi:hypothetical protein
MPTVNLNGDNTFTVVGTFDHLTHTVAGEASLTAPTSALLVPAGPWNAAFSFEGVVGCTVLEMPVFVIPQYVGSGTLFERTMEWKVIGPGASWVPEWGTTATHGAGQRMPGGYLTAAKSPGVSVFMKLHATPAPVEYIITNMESGRNPFSGWSTYSGTGDPPPDCTSFRITIDGGDYMIEVLT